MVPQVDRPTKAARGERKREREKERKREREKERKREREKERKREREKERKEGRDCCLSLSVLLGAVGKEVLKDLLTTGKYSKVVSVGRRTVELDSTIPQDKLVSDGEQNNDKQRIA